MGVPARCRHAMLGMLILLASACVEQRGQDPSAAGAPGDSPPIDVETHRSELEVGESAFITHFLVPVEGYHYTDERTAVFEHLLARHESIEAEIGEDFFGAISLHGVVADDPSQNTAQRWDGDWEVGYLAFIQLNEHAPFGIDEAFAEGAYGDEAIDRLELGGVEIFVFENPDSTNSRFTYSWLDHGVHGIIDGADREPLERWLAAYFAVPRLADGETEQLAARLEPLSGYAATNVDTAAENRPAELFGGAHYSMHGISDANGLLGRLVLTDTDDPLAVVRWLNEEFGLDPVDEVAIGDGAALHLVGIVAGVGQAHAFAWTEAGLTGAFSTNIDDLDAAERFLASFLTAEAAPIEPGDAATER